MDHKMHDVIYKTSYAEPKQKFLMMNAQINRLENHLNSHTYACTLAQ